MATALLLLDFQNEYVRPGGKLHDDVATVMHANDMLTKVPTVIQTARDNGAIVIHSPFIVNPDSSARKRRRTTFAFDIKGKFRANTWNAEIAEEVSPLDSDIVLEGRSTASALEGTNLSSVIKDNNIKTIVLLGFLADVGIVDTAIDLSDAFPELRIAVCSDGTASAGTLAKHQLGAMKKTFPTIGVDVIACKEAQDLIVNQPSSHGGSNILPIKSNEEALHAKYNVFEFQSLLRGACLLIPSGSIMSVYAQSSKDSFCSLSLSEIDTILDKTCGEDDVRKRALKALCRDIPSVFNFLAGLVLVLGTPAFSLPGVTRWQGLFVNFFYVVATTISIVGSPIRDWMGMAQVEANVREMKETIRAEAEAFESAKVHFRISVLRETKFAALPASFVQTMQYIEEIIFCGRGEPLTKADVELLLLRILGTSYSERTLEHVMQSASRPNSQTIGAVEFHHFIASDDKRFRLERFLGRTWAVLVETMIFNLGYLLSLAFVIAGLCGFFNWCFVQAGIQYDFFAYTWLYFVGTLGFSELAYEHVRDTYDARCRAKELLSVCFQYAQFYNQDMDVWQKFLRNDSFSINDMVQLIQQSDILLTESEVKYLVCQIDANGDGTITRDEFHSFLLCGQSNRNTTLLRLSLKDLSFISNTTWFLGAIGYAICHYSTGVIYSVCNYVGAFGYFLGGAAYCRLTYVTKKGDLVTMLSLKHATRRIMRTFARRGGARKTCFTQAVTTATRQSTIRQTLTNHDGDEESQLQSPLARMTWGRHAHWLANTRQTTLPPVEDDKAERRTTRMRLAMEMGMEMDSMPKVTNNGTRRQRQQTIVEESGAEERDAEDTFCPFCGAKANTSQQVQK